MKNFKIFSGRSNLPLSKKVAKILGVELGKAEIVRFADGECRVRLEEEVKSGTVFVLQSLCPPVDENLIELCLSGDTLKRNGAQNLVAVVPYLGYARQDKIHRKGECLSLGVVAKIIENVGFDRLITLDAHSEKTASFFKIPVENLSSAEILAEGLRSFLGVKKRGSVDLVDGYVVVAPDKGAMNRVQKLAKILGMKVALIEKDRDLLTGKLKIKGVKGEIARQKVAICDDMVTSGGTLILAAEVLKRQKAAQIFACATHPLLVKNAPQDLQKSVIERVIVTDSIPVPKEKRFKKLAVVSVAPLIAEAIENSV